MRERIYVKGSKPKCVDVTNYRPQWLIKMLISELWKSIK